MHDVFTAGCALVRHSDLISEGMQKMPAQDFLAAQAHFGQMAIFRIKDGNEGSSSHVKAAIQVSNRLQPRCLSKYRNTKPGNAKVMNKVTVTA